MQPRNTCSVTENPRNLQPADPPPRPASPLPRAGRGTGVLVTVVLALSVVLAGPAGSATAAPKAAATTSPAAAAKPVAAPKPVARKPAVPKPTVSKAAVSKAAVSTRTTPSNPTDSQINAAAAAKSKAASDVGRLSGLIVGVDARISRLSDVAELAGEKYLAARWKLGLAQTAATKAKTAVAAAQKNYDNARAQFRLYIAAAYMNRSGDSSGLLTAQNPNVLLQRNDLGRYTSVRQLNAIGTMTRATVARANAVSRARSALALRTTLTNDANAARLAAGRAVTSAKTQQVALVAQKGSYESQLTTAGEALTGLKNKRAAYLAWQVIQAKIRAEAVRRARIARAQLLAAQARERARLARVAAAQAQQRRDQEAAARLRAERAKATSAASASAASASAASASASANKSAGNAASANKSAGNAASANSPSGNKSSVNKSSAKSSGNTSSAKSSNNASSGGPSSGSSTKGSSSGGSSTKGKSSGSGSSSGGSSGGSSSGGSSGGSSSGGSGGSSGGSNSSGSSSGWSAAKGRAAVARAERWLGTPYSFAAGDASGPTYGTCVGGGNACHVKGFDCSGLSLYAWAGSGVYLDHFSVSQYLNAGSVHPSVDQLQPGDLVFWSTGGVSGIHHVAIYIGNGNVVEAPHTGDVVKITSLWMNGYFGATRPGT